MIYGGKADAVLGSIPALGNDMAWRNRRSKYPHLLKEFMYQIIGLLCFFAWLTHVFTCFAQGLWGFLIAGALLFPIGILHGFYLWFK